MLIGEGKTYTKVAFENEAEIEHLVQQHLELLFGPYALLILQSRISTAGGRSTVPDAVVIDFANKEWYLVEAERGIHGTWDHIAPQISRQLTALRHSETIDRLARTAIKALSQNDELREALTEELGLEQISFFACVTDILRTRPTVAIPIDEIPDDLMEWANTLKHEVRVWRIQKYVGRPENDVLYGFPEELTPDLETGGNAESRQSMKRQSSGRLFDQVVKAGLLREGQHVWMEYGPRGQAKNRYDGIVRAEGIEVDGRIYSPSAAAVICMQKFGSSRSSQNGWTMWKTDDGALIDECAKQLPNEDQATLPLG